MNHFDVTVEKDGALTTTRRGLRVSKQKHKGTSFVHSSAPQDDLTPSPPSRKKSSSSKSTSGEKKYKFVDDEETRGSSSRRSKTQEYDEYDEEDEEEDSRKSSKRRPKVSSRQTAPAALPPMSYSSAGGMGQGVLSFSAAPEMAGGVAYPPEQQATYGDFSYYPGTTTEMTYPVGAAWSDMGGVTAGGQEPLYPATYYDMGTQEGFVQEQPYEDMYYSGYDASGHQRYGGGAGGYP